MKICCVLILFVFVFVSLCFGKCPDIVTRQRWGARAATSVDYLITPIKYVIIHHTVTDNCTTEVECSEIISNIQDFHMDELNFHDIGYNFLVGGDGKIYEGTGYHKMGAHTYGYNSKSLGIAFIGNYRSIAPTVKQVEDTKDFLKCAVKNEILDSRYRLVGARQVSSTKSPGLTLFHEIQKWDHYEQIP